MSLNNKTFKDNKTGEIIKVIDSFENIAILENKTKIDVRRLMDPNLFTEQVDPNLFFNTQNAYNDLFEKIKTIPTENIPDESGEFKPTVNIDNRYTPPADDDSAVIYGTIDDEKAELAKKYGVNPDSTQSINRQNEAFARILGDSEEVNELPSTPISNKIPNEEVVQTIVVNRDEETIKPNSEPKEDPIYTMFRGVKRSVDFNLDLKLENKIPRLDFIEMMEDSYNKSIIDFLAEEFMNELLKDPKSLKESIKEKIKEMVYNKPKKIVRKTTTRKPATKKPTTKPTEKTVTKSKRTRRDLSDTKDMTDLSNLVKKETEKQND